MVACDQQQQTTGKNLHMVPGPVNAAGAAASGYNYGLRPYE